VPGSLLSRKLSLDCFPSTPTLLRKAASDRHKKAISKLTNCLILWPTTRLCFTRAFPATACSALRTCSSIPRRVR